MKQTKRLLSVLLAVMLLLAVVPVGNMSITASAITENEFNSKLSSFKSDYYAHGSHYNNNESGTLGSQCFGYANFIARYIFGSFPSSWASGASTNSNWTVTYGSSALDSLHIGDIIRYKSSSANHSVFVTGISGDTIYYTDANSDGNNTVKFDSSNTRSFFKTRVDLTCSDSGCLGWVGHYKDWNNTPIADVSVSTNKKHYSPNETATWSFDAKDASSVHLYIYKDGNKYFEGQFSTSATYSRKMTDTGHYAFHIIAHYPGGDVTSAWNDCNVSVLSAYLPSGRNLFYTGETVDFKFSAPFASSVHLYIFKDGAKFFEGQFSTSATYSRTISATGHYTFNIVAHYSTGDENGSEDGFDVVLPNVKTNKKTYQIGETAEFTFNAKGATSLHLYIYKDGNHWFEGQFSEQSTYSRCFDSAVNYAGEYYCYIIAHYDSGNYQSENYSFTVVSNHTHSYTSSVTRPATCSAPGVETFTCSCGDSYTKPIAVNANNHVNTKNVSATASTCTVKGYTAGVYCNDCKKYISGHQEQPLSAHTITVINKRDATYDAEGYTGDDYCTVCKQTIHTGTAIPKLVRPTDPTPSNPQPSGGCKWCGGNHGGAFGWLVKIIHNILAAIFGAKY